jgi:hypothetical protein
MMAANTTGTFNLRENRLVLSHYFDGALENIHSAQGELTNQIATTIFRCRKF